MCLKCSRTLIVYSWWRHHGEHYNRNSNRRHQHYTYVDFLQWCQPPTYGIEATSEGGLGGGGRLEGAQTTTTLETLLGACKGCREGVGDSVWTQLITLGVHFVDVHSTHGECHLFSQFIITNIELLSKGTMFQI